MQVRLADFIKHTPAGAEAEAILRACVHCGFCTATCPTYQLLGDERDGPRGRIYLIKQLLEGEKTSERTQLHLDRCLICRACETTCPSGVRYGRLLDIARGVLEKKGARAWSARLVRRGLRLLVPHARRFAWALMLATRLAPWLPPTWRRKIPLPRSASHPWPRPQGHRRKILLPSGCVQTVLAPGIDAALARVLDRVGVEALHPAGGCCGAVSYHLGAHEEALDFMRRNIDAWWPHVEQGIEAIVVTASGCGVMVKAYGEYLRHDPRYADKARHVASLARDPVELLSACDLSALPITPRRVAFQSPCTLQHGQKLAGAVEALLTKLGFMLTPVTDAHLCCGSAGTYSLLQPELAGRLRQNKLDALLQEAPELIATANIGCLTHLQAATHVPVKHWLELLDPE